MRKVAMLVANDVFPEDEKIETLRFAKSDAEALAEILGDKETCGFETRIYPDKTSQEVMADLEQISEELEPDDTLLFYYAGHGKLRKNGQLCLLSHETTMAKLGTKAIQAPDVVTFLRDSRARRGILILDCCQSGAIGRIFRGNEIEASLEGLDSSGCYILSASTANQLAEEREEDGHGVFTKALIDCLREDSKDRITLNDLYQYAFARLKGSGKQTPLAWTLKQEGASIEIANYVQKRRGEEARAKDERISKARIRFKPLRDSELVTQDEENRYYWLLERDEAQLWPRDRKIRRELICFVNGEITPKSFLAGEGTTSGVSVDQFFFEHLRRGGGESS